MAIVIVGLYTATFSIGWVVTRDVVYITGLQSAIESLAIVFYVYRVLQLMVALAGDALNPNEKLKVLVRRQLQTWTQEPFKLV